MIRLLCFCILLFSNYSSAKVIRGDAKEIILRISLNDTKITFPEPVLLRIRESYKKDFHFEVIDDIVYIKARKPLNKDKRYRLIAKTRSKKNQRSYILIISYDEKSEPEVTIIKEAKSTNNTIKSKNYIEPHELFRHASQALYSPSYLVEKPNLLKAVSVDKKLKLDSIYRGSSLKIRPITAWKYRDLYVYALSVENRRNTTQELMHENLYGRIDAVGVGFQHRFVGLNDDALSTLFIVSYHSNLTDLIGGI